MKSTKCFDHHEHGLAHPLAALAMVLTIGGIAAFAVAALGLPIGAAVLLGALLAPDPVLASDVQVSDEHDAEPVRFSLTAEAGLRRC